MPAAPVLAEESMDFSLEELEAGGDPDSTPGQAGEPAATAPDVDIDAAVRTALGELRWGMSKKELLSIFKARLRAEYDERIKRELDVVRQDALYQAARQKYDAIKRGFVIFDGAKTGWDVSPIAGEFRHKSHEAMLVVQAEGSRDYYFFINNRLWKWYRELNPAAHAGADFQSVAEAMQGAFGPASVDDLARAEGSTPLPTAFWQNEQTRVSVLSRGAATCVVFESQRTLAALPILRKDAMARGPKQNAVLQGILMDEDERETWRQAQDFSQSPVDAEIARRSRK
ncbi:MAG: hypothetical protein OEZ06_13930 [Myxococcales bacterium]|nr:hypothetical protein [Myxococcales bacterium]